MYQQSRYENSIYRKTRMSEDYIQARHATRWFWLRSVLTRVSSRLLSFEEVQRRLDLRGHRDAGVQTVSLAHIVGSVGRHRDFDRAFHPLREHSRERWMRIAAIADQGGHLPPLELYQVDTFYFVVDGHHRISVASARGQVDIEAYITVFDAPAESLRPFLESGWRHTWRILGRAWRDFGRLDQDVRMTTTMSMPACP